MGQLCDDLAAESTDLDALVGVLPNERWDVATPAEGWTVRDQIYHLAFFDRAGIVAIEDPEEFAAMASALGTDLAAAEAAHVAEARAMGGEAVLEWFRQERERLLKLFRTMDPSARVPWYGPPMAAPSFVTARLMETWAHGQDVADALDVERKPSARLRHIAHLGVRTRGFSYQVRGRDQPDGEVRVELTAPNGETWTWGADDASDRVHGPALDFCLVVTQRRHIADTQLQADGPLASEWLSLAQAFAGPPGPGREPSR